LAPGIARPKRAGRTKEFLGRFLADQLDGTRIVATSLAA
jgi:hypothetical protein